MDITLPAIPAGALVLLAFFAPYAQAIIQRPEWPAKWKKVVTVAVAVVLTVIVLAFYYFMTGDVVPAWPVFVILAITVAAASYALITKPSATALEIATSPK
ncbi:hypothetical protein [Microbacterium sp. BR1]|uniref:hypothetical protein n=1 Tax=Microbacterium sp. BR1 TaxID=1070896 RepID=UPI000C2C4E52|nr:hypothetical protein [Microbacterium sp. BR1]